MHKNPLIQFIHDKVNETPGLDRTGPVVTISREFGCPGNQLGHRIAEILTTRGKGASDPWKALNKEIMVEAAREVNLSPALVEKIANQKQHSIFTDFFVTFSDHYTPSDMEVKKAVAGVIRTMAMQGRVILIGRGSVSLTQDLDDSIHIFLYGSKDWRVQKAMERLEVSDEDEAKRKLEKIDFERSYLRNFYAGKSTDLNYYDVCFNAETMSVEEMAETIISLMDRRGYLA